MSQESSDETLTVTLKVLKKSKELQSYCNKTSNRTMHFFNVIGKEKIQITKDGDTKWYDIEHLRGLQVVNVEEESWVSLVDLQHDENVQIGKRQFESPIAVVPSQGYTKRDNYSKVSIQWLEWLMEKSRQRGNPIHISHALNGGEYQIPGTNYRCDGFVPSPTGKGTVYEFYGCVFHGCPSCYAEDRHHLRHPSTNQTIQELYEMTKKRERELKDLGYKVVFIWEHQFKYQLEKNAALQQFVSTLDIQDRLDPRDSFFGGRTNAIKLHYKAAEDETIQTCADDENQNDCTCSLEERAITGTWCTPEIQMAMSKGYTILNIYEVYHFAESSMYDADSCEGGLFTQTQLFAVLVCFVDKTIIL
uniref:Uncharacterized protein n=1 Tax=Magallana gigas TaxID=29159 RepID=A0A8W8MKJ3_MAGGI